MQGFDSPSHLQYLILGGSMKTKMLKEFKFNYAQYDLKDIANVVVILKVDYKNNTYTTRSDRLLDPETKQEISRIAQDLLTRKSGINIAER